MLFSCVSPVKVMKPEGDKAIIVVDNYREYRAELLAVNDTSLIFDNSGRLYSIGWDQVKSVSVIGYNPRFYALPGFYIITDLIAGPALLQIYPPIGVLAFVHAGCIMMSLYDQSQHSFFKPGSLAKDRERLKPYCRYPQGLTEPQWREVLTVYEQEGFKEL